MSNRNEVQNLIDKLGISFSELKNEIRLTLVALNEIPASLGTSVCRSNMSSKDLEKEIQNDFLNKRRLSRRKFKYLWSNFQMFKSEILEWSVVSCDLDGHEIERILLKSWQFFAFSNFNFPFELLEQKNLKPSFLVNWRALQGNSSSEETAKVAGNMLLAQQIVARDLKKSTFFHYLLAQYIHVYLRPNYFLQFESLLLEQGLKGLTIPEILKSNQNNYATQFIVAGLLRANSGDPRQRSKYQDYLSNVKEIFGDPRSITTRWDDIRRIERAGYDFWLESLNEEDIQFFFDNLHGVVHPERRTFWLKFKRSARRVAVVLDENNRNRIAQKFSGDQKIEQVVKRSYQFARQKVSQQQLIILFFNGIVIVEGSNTGFACQVYEESDFRSRFDEFFLKNSTLDSYLIHKTYDSFRGRSSPVKFKLTHNKDWENSFLKNLAEYGVYPDQEVVHATHTSLDNHNLKSSNEIQLSVDKSKPIDSTKGSNTKLVGILIQSIHRKNAEIVDNRASGGVLWIIYRRNLAFDIDTAREMGIKIFYKSNGSKATNGRPAWWLK